MAGAARTQFVVRFSSDYACNSVKELQALLFYVFITIQKPSGFPVIPHS